MILLYLLFVSIIYVAPFICWDQPLTDWNGMQRMHKVLNIAKKQRGEARKSNRKKASQRVVKHEI